MSVSDVCCPLRSAHVLDLPGATCALLWVVVCPRRGKSDDAGCLWPNCVPDLFGIFSVDTIYLRSVTPDKLEEFMNCEVLPKAASTLPQNLEVSMPPPHRMDGTQLTFLSISYGISRA